MENSKIERIKNIKDEVNEFHPLLRNLFSKLPDINSVEYQHGPQEMGADFVLTKTDSTLDDIEYIGCIVKVGQIKQDYTEINRQIEECDIERTIEGGLRKIFISEIWVVTSGSITNNAQTKIHNAYKNRNIKFISGEKVATLIDRHYPEYWKDINIHIGEYLRKIRDIADTLGNSSNLLDLNKSDVYVDQYLIKRTTNRTFFHKKTLNHKRTTIKEVIKNNDYVLVEAMMGTGKSTLISRIAKAYTESENYNLDRILPILVTAKEMINTYNSDVSYLINTTITNNSIEGEQGYLVLIDALDELKITSDERLEFLKNLYGSCAQHKNIKIVLTTRNIEDPEIDAEIDKIFSRYDLCLWTVKQVLTLVGKFCKNIEIISRLSRDLDKSQIFRVLPRTPMSAILLAKLLNENVQEIPSTMTELYSKYMELVLGRWDMDKGLQSQTEYDTINNVTINIAKFIISNSLIEISIGDVRDILEDYTSSRNLQVDKELVFSKLINKLEIFKFNKAKNTFAFRHRTFAEYFFALGMIRDNTALINEDIFDLYWATSYFFFIGMKRDCPDLINAIDDIIYSSDKHRLLKTFNNGNFLLAAYLTPYEVIKKSVRQSFNEVANLYCKTLSHESKNPLSKLSAIQLLCLFTHCFCDTYGYDFFNDALEERALDLCTCNSLDDLGYTELFLINSVLLSINKSNAYDTMIETYGKNIPLQFQVGISEHAVDRGTESPIVKKYFKNRKSNHSLNKTILALYQDPVDEKNSA